MHPDLVATKKDEAHAKVLEVVLKHSAKDEEFEQSVAGEGGPGVAEVRDAKALAKLAELVDQLYEAKTTSKAKKSTTTSKEKTS
jgi:hypothetical protein